MSVSLNESRGSDTRRDTTTRILELEERYRLVAETISDAIFLLDPDGRVVFCNAAAEKITGRRKEELNGQWFASFLTEEGAQVARARIKAVQVGKEVPPVFETEMVQKDRGRRWIEVSFVGVLQAGRLAGRLGVVRDITERKWLQEQLRQVEKLATLGELIAGIAHELNNPLAVLMGNAQLLEMTEHDTLTKARVSRIVRAADRAARVVRNFLTFARRHQPQQVPVHVNDAVANTLDLLAYQLRVANITVETDLAADLPEIAGDPHQLQQVLLNVINNACQALTAAHKRGTLRVATVLSDDRRMVSISVADDGPGIPPEHLARVFEPFFTTKPAGVGTGLGLAIARGIVSEHGGTISVEGVPGVGATFVVSLPVSVVPPPSRSAAESRMIPTGLRILVVDDEVAVREMLADALTARGNRIETAASGEEALGVLARWPVDVVVLDARMPGMAGPEFWIRVNQRDPGLARRIVFCTGDVIGEQLGHFLESSGVAAVSKPFDWLDFFDVVGRAAAR